MNYQTGMLLKFCLGSEIHILNLPTPTLPQLTAKLPALFRGLPSAYTLSYLDQDGDQIALRSQQDLDVLLKSGAKSAKVLIEEVKESFLEMGDMTEQVLVMDEEDICVEEEKMEEEEKKEEKKVEKEEKKEEEGEERNEEAIIEEKLMRMMPEIVSKIRQEMREEKQKKEAPSKMAEEGVVVHESVTCDSCSAQNIQGIRYKCAVCPDFDFCEKCEALVSHPHPFLKIRNLQQTPLKIITVLRSEDETCTVNGHNIKNLVQHGLDFLKGVVGEEKAEEMKAKFMNMRQEWHKQRGNWGCFRKEGTCGEKKEEKKEEKMGEKKEEMKEEKKEGMKEDSYDVEMEHIVSNANYLMEVFGSEFDRCFYWSQKYPGFSREELLNACLDNPDFLQ